MKFKAWAKAHAFSDGDLEGDIFTATDVMAKPVQCISRFATQKKIQALLADNSRPGGCCGLLAPDGLMRATLLLANRSEF